MDYINKCFFKTFALIFKKEYLVCIIFDLITFNYFEFYLKKLVMMHFWQKNSRNTSSLLPIKIQIKNRSRARVRIQEPNSFTPEKISFQIIRDARNIAARFELLKKWKKIGACFPLLHTMIMSPWSSIKSRMY